MSNEIKVSCLQYTSLQNEHETLIKIEDLIKKASVNLGTDKEGLKKVMEANNLSFKYLEKKFEIDLKWNSLIFDLYKNKVVLNMAEVKEKISYELEKIG